MLTASRLVQRKGVGTTIAAVAQLVAAGRDVELVIVGGAGTAGADLPDDPEYQRLDALARGLGIARPRLVPRAARPGGHGRGVPERRRRRVRALVRAVRHRPARGDGLRAPVVASRVGGLIDTVVEDATGLHVATARRGRPGRPRSAALLDDPERRAAYGRAGRRRAESRYTWQKVATDTERVYERLVAGGRGRPVRPASGTTSPTTRIPDSVRPAEEQLADAALPITERNAR